MKTKRNLSRTEIQELAKKNELKFMFDIDYAYVFEFNSKQGLRVNDVTSTKLYNNWCFQNYGNSTPLDCVKSDKILKFLTDLQNA